MKLEVQSILRPLALAIVFTVSTPLFAQSVDDSLRSLSGKDFIFLGHKQDKVLKLSEKELSRRKEECVVAVTVLTASFSENRWQFDLKAFGAPSRGEDSGLPKPKPCSNTSFDSRLVITDDGSSGRESVLRSILNNVLVTPEIYLARHGKAIEYREADEAESAAAVKPAKGIQPKLILAVEPFHNENSPTASFDPSTEASVVVGTHGRIQSPQIVKGLDTETDRRAIRALSFWRLEPAQIGGRPVPVRIQIIFRFRIR